jgi:methionyl-tRNA synthetase
MRPGLTFRFPLCAKRLIVLPDKEIMKKQKFYVTTPIYYVNDRPHIGHSYTTVLADVLARYHRLLGDPTFFLTGTDEHGQKVQQAAQKAHITPQEQADQTVVRFQELWRKLNITHDDFIRTTEVRHTRVVQAILQDLYDRGEIYSAEYDGWYCLTCERFFTDKDLADGTCPECRRPVDKIREANYFFRMSRHQDWLIQYIQEHPQFIQPDSRRNETLGFLRNKLNDLCISRPKSRMAWGIELPFDSAYVTYVWFDALVNYISAVGYRSNEALFNKWWPASYHLIGKDILTTHTVYWPTMLQAMGLPQPETVFAHGWWLVGDSKMSKSAGNVVNPMDMVDRFGVDAFRYFLMAEMVLGQDASFTEDAFVRRYNADLANDLGNFLSRTLKMISANTGNRIPASGPDGVDEPVLRAAVLSAAQAMPGAISGMRLDLGLANVAQAVREANRYLEKRQPWTLAKNKDLPALSTVLYHAAEALRIISGLLYPVMPEKMASLRRTLGLPEGDPGISDLTVWGKTMAGTEVGPMQILFPRIEKPEASADVPVKAAPTASVALPVAAPEGLALIEYADFQKVQLRSAKVLSAERIEKADKLLRLQIEVGTETRQIVAGISQSYTPEQVMGKTVILVANLKPAKIRGVDSQGMLLAASSGGQLRLVTVDGDLPSGAVVK